MLQLCTCVNEKFTRFQPITSRWYFHVNYYTCNISRYLRVACYFTRWVKLQATRKFLLVLYVKPSNKGFIIPLLSHFQVFWHLVYEIHSLACPDNNRRRSQRTKTTIMKPSKCYLGWLKKSSPKYRKEIKDLIMIIQCGHFVFPPSVCISALLYSVLWPLIVANMVEWRKITQDGVTLDRSH